MGFTLDSVNFYKGIGGAIYGDEQYSVWEDNLILDNKADVNGGLYLVGSARLTGNAIIGNIAENGTGGADLFGIAYVANNLVAHNTGGTTGGLSALGIDDSTQYLVNNTFYNNNATNTLGYGAGGLKVAQNTELSNNLFWKNSVNSASDVAKADFYAYATSEYFSTCRNNAFQLPASAYTVADSGLNPIGANAANNVFGVEPLFLNENDPAGPDGLYGTGDDGLQLVNSSPLLDAGATALLPPGLTQDIRKAMRVYGAAPDPGAYELGCLPGNSSSAQDMSICKGNSTTLTVNTAALPQHIAWYADSTTATALATGYSYTTPVLQSTDTFWVAAANCTDNARVPVRVYVNATIAQNGPVLQVDAGGSSYQWYRCDSFQAIDGATGPVYVATVNGSYTVVATQNGCTDTAACATVDGFALPPDTTQPTAGPGERLMVAPNPTTGMLEIAIPTLGSSASLMILNMQGMTLYKSAVTSAQVVKLDVSDYPGGIYYVVLTDGKRQYVSKVSKR